MNTEEQILEAAESVFLEKGFSGARTNEISERAGVNHALLHYYFRTKAHLFELVVKKNLSELAHSLTSAFSATDKIGAEEILKGVRAHFAILRRKPLLPRFVVTEVFSKPERSQFVKNYMTEIIEPIVSIVHCSLVAAGSAIDARTLIYDIVALNCFPFLSLPIAPAFGMDTDTFLDQRIEENVALIRSRIDL